MVRGFTLINMYHALINQLLSSPNLDRTMNAKFKSACENGILDFKFSGHGRSIVHSGRTLATLQLEEAERHAECGLEIV